MLARWQSCQYASVKPAPFAIQFGGMDVAGQRGYSQKYEYVPIHFPTPSSTLNSSRQRATSIAAMMNFFTTGYGRRGCGWCCCLATAGGLPVLGRYLDLLAIDEQIVGAWFGQ